MIDELELYNEIKKRCTLLLAFTEKTDRSSKFHREFYRISERFAILVNKNVRTKNHSYVMFDLADEEPIFYESTTKILKRLRHV